MDYHEKVVVVGAGVIGITSALAIKIQFPKLEVIIIAEKYSPDTTGDGSAGLWDPYLIQDTPDTNILFVSYHLNFIFLYAFIYLFICLFNYK